MMGFSARAFGVVAAAAAAAPAGILSACGGELSVVEAEPPGGRGDRCTSSADCTYGYVCGACTEAEGSCCTASEGPCSPVVPDGDCGRDSICVSGVCVPEGTSYCECAPSQACVGGACEDIAEEERCGPNRPQGLCAGAELCVGGQCVPCSDASACSTTRPDGCCAAGAACQNGRCYPTDTLPPCSADNLSGWCPAGETCTSEGVCAATNCSIDEPIGACPAGSYCEGGSCACIPCSQAHPDGCCESGSFCSVAGVCAVDGTCMGDDDCDEHTFCSVTGSCIADGTCAAPGDCASGQCEEAECIAACDNTDDCGPRQHCDAPVCVKDTCSSLDCSGLHRQCENAALGAICTTCITGFRDTGAAACAPNDCGDIDCSVQNRQCDLSGPYAICGDCLLGFTEDALGTCRECTHTAECPPAHYCSSAGACTQDCDPALPDACLAGWRCAPYGRCVTDTPTGDVCAAAVEEGERVEPVVMIMVDQSNSMTTHYDVGSRWQDLHDVLFADDGVVKPLQDQVIFGLVLFTKNGSTCPALTYQTPTLGNLAAMDARYDASAPLSDTPTGDSTKVVTAYLQGLGLDNPKYLLIATDGEPDSCEQPNPQRGQAESVVAAKHAFDAGIKVFVLSVGAEVTDGHLQDLADAGMGCTVGAAYDPSALDCSQGSCFNGTNGTCTRTTNCTTAQRDCCNKQDDVGIVSCGVDGNGDPIHHPFYKATSRAQLVDALTKIIGSVLSCTVRLNELPGYTYSDGLVMLDGEVLPYGLPDGWVVGANHSIELVGQSCTAVKDGQPHFISVEFRTCVPPG